MKKMVKRKRIKNEMILNSLSSKKQNVKRVVKTSKLKGKELTRAITEAQKDPEFIREIRKFVKITTN